MKLCILLLVALSVCAVPLRKQQITADGFVLDTLECGKIEVHVVAIQQGSQTQVTVLKNDVQTAQTTFQSPTAAQVEAWVHTNVGVQLNVKNGTIDVGTMQFRFKIVTFNPFVVKLIAANNGVTIADDWWTK